MKTPSARVLPLIAICLAFPIFSAEVVQVAKERTGPAVPGAIDACAQAGGEHATSFHWTPQRSGHELLRVAGDGAGQK